MASLYIRDLDAHLVLALRRKALDEGKTLKQLVTPMLELLVNSKPVEGLRLGKEFSQFINRRGDIGPEPED